MRLHDGRAAPTRKKAWRLKLATEELLKVGFATGVQMASLIGHFTFVFLLRRPCLSVFCTIYQFIQRAGVRRRSLWNCGRRELQAASRLLVRAFSDLSLQVQQQVYCSDACPQGWAAHAREWPLQEVERQLAWNERWRFKWTEGQPARSCALNNSNEQSNLDGHWTIEPDFPEIDPSLLAPSSWQLLKRGRYTYKEPIHLKEARAMHFKARRAARRCMTRGRVVLMLCDNMGLVLACEKGRCTDPVLQRILRRYAAISLASGARFRIDGCLQNCVPLMKPRGGTTENRRSWRRAVGSQDLRRSVDPRSTGRHSEVVNGLVRRAGPEEPPKTILPSSPTFGTSVGLGVNTGSTRSHLEQASVKATTLPPVPKNLSTPTSLEMAMIQYFDHLFFKGSPSGIGRTVLASVCHCRPDWALCLRSDVGRIKKALKGWERLVRGNSKDPLPWILVLNQHGHFEMSTATLLATDAYLRPGEIGSLKGNSLVPQRREAGAPFDQWALHLFPREGGLASKTQQHDDTIVLDSSSRPWQGPLVNLIAQTRKRDEKLFSFTIDAWRKELRAAAHRLQVGQDNRRSPEAGQVARLNVSSPPRKVSTSLTLGGRPSGAGPCHDSGARSKSTCEPDASKPQRARPEACTAQTFTKRCRDSPHFQALKGRTAGVLMDAGAPFAKALWCLGLVVHSCPLETLRMPQARDRISRLCRESSFVVYATIPLTFVDGVLAVRDSHGKPWPDTSSRTTGRCRTEDRIFAWVATLWRYLSSRGVPQMFVASAKCAVNTEPGLRILLK